VPPNPRVQRTRSSPSARHSPLTRHPLGRPGTRGPGAAVIMAVSMACVPYRPLSITAEAAASVRGGAMFFVASSNCSASAHVARTIEPWLRKWFPAAAIATDADVADVVIEWQEEPCVVCVDCDKLPVPRRASATLQFRNGQKAMWQASQPVACATQNCLPPMLAKAIAKAWRPA
jgi:hypothetical protein